MRNCFTEHPKSVNETYCQHLLFSMRCAFALLIASIAGFIHAFFPFLCVDTCSNLVAKLASRYCKGGRRHGFLKKLNQHLLSSGQGAIKLEEFDV